MQQEHLIRKGRLALAAARGVARGVTFGGVEILRGLSAPVRDRQWGTYATSIDHELAETSHYRCAFSHAHGLFNGQIVIELVSERRLTAQLSLTFAAVAEINRAGFCLLHPIENIRGSPVTIRHSNGTDEDAVFPRSISPGQPARDIVALTHRVGPVSVHIALGGEVFEMEDQRNWSDASFKTYCRPLSAPKPFRVAAGETLRQSVVLDILDFADPDIGTAKAITAETAMPQITLAYEADLCSARALDHFTDVPVLARITPAAEESDLALLAARRDVALEVVFEKLSDIDAVAQRCTSAGLRPIRVAALPASYLKSHQPEGPWPPGPQPDDGLPRLGRAFPGVPAGGGSLTYFAEFNRCPPGEGAAFLTFGNTAIVHAADDASVMQTLEALPDLFASAQGLRPGRPLHLGLFSIGMRSNPYGADVQGNPGGEPIPMARWDKRQNEDFAAAYAIGVVAEAARAGVQSLALAMPDGELGAEGRPIGQVIAALAPHAGQPVSVTVDSGLYRLQVGQIELVANLSPALRQIDRLAPASFRIVEHPQ
ncbi:hypothetical protein [Devosia submarina]|uniref:hypothetical protein n=1 Tax=Devosia submarina TaxID=1173082 RepID=UPI000D3D26B0|nr:hypothetical protein [Devosia submarina]